MSRFSKTALSVLTVAAVVAVAIGWPATASAITGDEMCKAMHWPIESPQVSCRFLLS